MVHCHVLLRSRVLKLLAASTSTIEWYKSSAHISFLSEVIQILYVPTQCEKGRAYHLSHIYVHVHVLGTSFKKDTTATKESIFVREVSSFQREKWMVFVHL